MFDNLHDGGANAKSEAALDDDWAFVVTSMCSSEGENINMNINNLSQKLKEFMITGRISNRFTRLADAFSRFHGEEYQIPETKERWLLLDAIDSGFSIDNVVETKDFFKMVIKDFANHGYDLYIVVSANEYELANGENCFDVMSGKYVQFKDYDDFKKFIMRSREKKDKRYNKRQRREQKWTRRWKIEKTL